MFSVAKILFICFVRLKILQSHPVASLGWIDTVFRVHPTFPLLEIVKHKMCIDQHLKIVHSKCTIYSSLTNNDA